MSRKKLKIGHWNAQSLLPKMNEIRHLLYVDGYDILVISETWLDENISDAMIRIVGYKCVRKDRPTRAGGICVFLRDNFTFRIVDNIEESDTCEQLWLSVKLAQLTLAVGAVYRPPRTNIMKFFDTLESTFAMVSVSNETVVCLGDLNVNLLNDNNTTTMFQSLLEGMGLKQIISQPTRITANSFSLIDVIIISDDLNIKSNEVRDLGTSDHNFVGCIINTLVQKNKSCSRSFRDFSKFNAKDFEADMLVLDWDNIVKTTDVNKKIEIFNNYLMALYDIHAPLKTKIYTKPPAPWLTYNLKIMIKLRDKALKRFKSTKRQEHHEYYKELRNYTTSAIRAEQKAYYNQKLESAEDKDRWRILRDLNLCRSKGGDFSGLKLNANEINTKFAQITNTPSQSDPEILNFYSKNYKTDFVSKLNFTPVCEYDISQIILKIKTKSSGIDNINITMVRLLCPFIIPHITHIINFCLVNSVFPDLWKKGKIIPIAKTKNPNTIDELRAITILPILSKILEVIVSIQMKTHLIKYKILPDIQSGFREGFSCGTALLSICDGILSGLDEKKSTILVFLDYSKAFDMLNYDILLSILKYIGLADTAISFFKNYLHGRSQQVYYSNELSSAMSVKRGIAQGSILGPLLFTIYTSQFTSAIHNSQMHMYADDVQIYHIFDQHNLAAGEHNINTDLSALIELSEKHNLKINGTKSFYMTVGKFSCQPNITIAGNAINRVDKIKNLGIVLDSKLNFEHHVSYILQKSYSKLKLLYSNRNLMSTKLRLILCDSLILSICNHADYVYGPCIRSHDADRIQKLQNSCLRLTYGIKKFDHISQAMIKSGWLNMKNRRLLHELTLYHKIIKTSTPPYLSNEIKYRTDVHNLNLRLKKSIHLPKFRTSQYKRSFKYNIASKYNAIPDEYKQLSLKRFKYLMKVKLLNDQNNVV